MEVPTSIYKSNIHPATFAKPGSFIGPVHVAERIITASGKVTALGVLPGDVPIPYAPGQREAILAEVRDAIGTLKTDLSDAIESALQVTECMSFLDRLKFAWQAIWWRP